MKIEYDWHAARKALMPRTVKALEICDMIHLAIKQHYKLRGWGMEPSEIHEMAWDLTKRFLDEMGEEL